MDTGADGTWSVPKVAPGRVHVTVTKSGYLPATDDEDLQPGEETDLVLRLDHEPAPPPPAVDAGASAVDAGPPIPVEEVTVKGEKPPREVTKRTLDKGEIERIPGTNGDALKSLQNLPGVARPPPLSGHPHRARLGAGGHAGVRRRDAHPHPLPLRRAVLGHPHRAAREDRLLSRQLQRAVRPRHGRHGRRRHPRPEEGRLPRDGQVDFIDARLLAEGPIGEPGGASSWRRGARGSTSGSAPVLTRTGAGVTVAPRYYDYQARSPEGHRHALVLPAHVLRLGRRALAPPPDASRAANPTLAGSFCDHTELLAPPGPVQEQVSTTRTELRVVAAVGQDTMDYRRRRPPSATPRSTPVTARVELSREGRPRLVANVGLDFSYVPYKLDINRPPPRAAGRRLRRPRRRAADDERLGHPSSAGAVHRVGARPLAWARASCPACALDYASPTQTWDFAPRVDRPAGIAKRLPADGRSRAASASSTSRRSRTEIDPVFGTPGLTSTAASSRSTAASSRTSPASSGSRSTSSTSSSTDLVDRPAQRQLGHGAGVRLGVPPPLQGRRALLRVDLLHHLAQRAQRRARRTRSTSSSTTSRTSSPSSGATSSGGAGESGPASGSRPATCTRPQSTAPTTRPSATNLAARPRTRPTARACPHLPRSSTSASTRCGSSRSGSSRWYLDVQNVYNQAQRRGSQLQLQLHPVGLRQGPAHPAEHRPAR